MNTGDETHTAGAAKELTRQEAEEKRAYYLALYRQYEAAERAADAGQVDEAESTMATFILPGD